MFGYLRMKGRINIADKFEEGTYQVEEQVANLPVYKVKGQSDFLRTLHRNHLLLVKHPNKYEDESEEDNVNSTPDQTDAVDVFFHGEGGVHAEESAELHDTPL